MTFIHYILVLIIWYITSKIIKISDLFKNIITNCYLVVTGYFPLNAIVFVFVFVIEISMLCSFVN
jgi:hypothetical protein